MATGEGDLEAAWQLKQDQLTRHHAPGAFSWEFADATHALATDDNELALEVFVRMSDNPSQDDVYYIWGDIMAFLLADRLGDEGACAQILQAYQERDVESEEVSPMTELLSLFNEASRDETLDPLRVQELANRFGQGWQTAIPMFAGYFEWTNGHTDAAIENWLVPARDTSCLNQMLAWKWLREAGVDPVHIEGRIFREMFLQEPHQLPEKKR